MRSVSTQDKQIFVIVVYARHGCDYCPTAGTFGFTGSKSKGSNSYSEKKAILWVAGVQRGKAPSVTCKESYPIEVRSEQCEDVNKRLDAIENELRLFKTKEGYFQRQQLEDAMKIKRLEELVSSQQRANLQQNYRVAALENTLRNLTVFGSVKDAKRLVVSSSPAELIDAGQVGFSTYLDHDLDGVANKQKIVFNQVLFNDGAGYDLATGVFTSPRDGVYLFIYFVGNRHDREVDAELVVNGIMQNEAVAEGVASAHDTQGGNSAILRLVQGDKVWVDTTLGSHVEGQWRFTSFSGALLYPQ